MVLKIEHETSPAIALAVLRSRRFLAGPILSDSGLNVIFDDQENIGCHSGQAVCTGALMTFNWTGPVSKIYCSSGYPPNVLYDQRPHRGFVPVGTTNFLTLVNIELIGEASWQEAVVRPKFIFGSSPRLWVYWLKSHSESWRLNEMKKIQTEIEALRRSPVSICISFPPSSIYEMYLRRKFPSIN